MKTKTEDSFAPQHTARMGLLSVADGETRTRLSVPKAYKMYVGGAFVRSESGRYLQQKGVPGGSADATTVNVPRASRKDVRDAVLAARNAWEGWSARTAYNRGQILYRLAEVLESRRPELETLLLSGGEARAKEEMSLAIDRTVYYAGFSDKFQSLLASSNPVSGPHFGFSVPESMGVVGVVLPRRPSVLGLLSAVLPIVVSGNTVVAVVSEDDPRSPLVLGECFATSDMPGGVVNVLSGQVKELAPHLAKHREVFGLDLWSLEPDLLRSCQSEASTNIKRVRTHAASDDLFSDRGEGLSCIEAFVETKTVWHPVGV